MPEIIPDAITGAAPWMATVNRQMIRSPINPMDKSTIVSILPKLISERKVTMQPGIFEIQPGTFDKPAILVVGTSNWWKEVGEHEPLLEISVGSVTVANSVVQDYCNGLFGCNMGDKMPGLFWVPGKFTIEQIKAQFSPLLLKARDNQKRWFQELVRAADILWARSSGNPLSISDDSRLAARELNLENKEWMNDLVKFELVRCVACGALRNPQFPICQTCKAIADPELAKKLNLTFAQ